MSETPNHGKKGGPVFGYLTVLFAAAFFMLLLAFFIQQRDDGVALERRSTPLSISVSEVEQPADFP